jgi:2-succinyl-5-enolpyruvyl-6-hydroxy-3-cyclohexene-1-carboxylate synthase
MTAPNRNLLWTQTFVEELALCGIEHVVIAPGSRSTPLVMAFAQHGGFRVHSLIDERSAAFFALGIGLNTGKPAALVCSSGTATANFYPAVIEANYANVPLLVLTADRPHELRDSGANQTVNQIGLYGQHVRWFFDVPLPESNPSGVVLRSLRTLACRAVAETTGINAGPVHLNFPFRKPLEPLYVPTDDTTGIPPRPDSRPFVHITAAHQAPTPAQIDTLAGLLSMSRHPLVIAGPRAAASSSDPLIAVVKHLSRVGIPVLADPLSNLRYADSGAFSAYDAFGLNTLPHTPDLVILLGGLPASKAIEDFLVKTDLPAVVLLTANGRWTDPYHRLTHLFQADPATLITSALAQSSPDLDRSWGVWFATHEQATREMLENELKSRWFDGSIVAQVCAQLPPESNLFIGNSLPVRHLEQFALADGKPRRVFCNRGTSGIDGTVSTVYGIAAASPDRLTVFITGDLAFYHDMNGFLAANRLKLKVITVLINNDGGGIFRALPIAGFEPTFTDLFLTPHGLDFSHAAHLYGIHYARIGTSGQLAEALSSAMVSPASTVIEAPTDGDQDAQHKQDVVSLVRRQHNPKSVVSG